MRQIYNRSVGLVTGRKLLKSECARILARDRYKPAMDSAVSHELEPGLRARVVTGVFFCATKLEAFAGRGKNDYLSSHDLEDLIAVVDGRAELVEEIQAGPEDVRTYIASEIKKLIAISAFYRCVAWLSAT
jgi:hypothetical protein